MVVTGIMLNTEKIQGVESIKMGNSELYIKVPQYVEGYKPIVKYN